MAVNFTFVALASAFPFYPRYVLLATEAQTSLLPAAVFLAAFAMLPVWSWLCRRRGARGAAPDRFTCPGRSPRPRA